ncbi:xanthine dehydrogenase family protein subunit M [Acidiphilium sp. JA12-A1]|uniref:FAD binding domain-containing protein n=1 Tax=Acidiphilium sp. JA12-A1 TaxID=1464546 RepID=UPI000461D605|nr:xanthine dehydrogenase family protein subunit M [Acidiphilium sp. JA12-A1]KDM67090.1 6-hydroxypseudooxynicotine dehydrogenase complex subunit alpha [Acidiphilium sp. JA12-A1]
MKPAPFDYVRAGSVAEAVGLLAAHEGAKLLAGGQSLLPALNFRLSAPGLLVDIGPIADLRRIDVTATMLRIGAGCTHAMLLDAPEIAAHAPLIATALAHVAHPAIRSRGTIGGSLANADPAAELPACMLALDATIIAEGQAGARRIAAADFFTGLFETALEPGEILTAVEIPLVPGRRHGFAELARRHGDYALVGLAAAMEGRIVRLGFFAVGHAALRAPAAERALADGALADGAAGIEAACAALAEDLPPHADPEISAPVRLHLARVLLRRVMKECLAP